MLLRVEAGIIQKFDNGSYDIPVEAWIGFARCQPGPHACIKIRFGVVDMTELCRHSAGDGATLRRGAAQAGQSGPMGRPHGRIDFLMRFIHNTSLFHFNFIQYSRKIHILIKYSSSGSDQSPFNGSNTFIAIHLYSVHIRKLTRHARPIRLKGVFRPS
ncbi:hypothetical protein [Komagataeibacter xylinus]|uniref:Uncharacterized protein n=1 Tax=Komagataeibacter xylinus TaxID=28448 RepID=A0A857FQF4_KOMXY|nr:hypothetical protein [Komagataeibacter xylinus]QHC36396.1 hypothetical protein FMA36_13605 [Komagataeibacter xylinus]